MGTYTFACFLYMPCCAMSFVDIIGIIYMVRFYSYGWSMSMIAVDNYG